MYNELYHHGILGQKWGIRRFQNPDGSLTEAGKRRYGVAASKSPYASGKNGTKQKRTSRNNRISPRAVAAQLSDDDLSKAIARMKKEIEYIDNYNRLHPVKKSVAKDLFTDLGKTAAKTFGTAMINTVVKQIFPNGGGYDKKKGNDDDDDNSSGENRKKSSGNESKQNKQPENKQPENKQTENKQSNKKAGFASEPAGLGVDTSKIFSDSNEYAGRGSNHYRPPTRVAKEFGLGEYVSSGKEAVESLPEQVMKQTLVSEIISGNDYAMW